VGFTIRALSACFQYVIEIPKRCFIPFLLEIRRYILSLNRQRSYFQVRGFAPIGMIEQWNRGRMGSGFRLGEGNAMLD